MILSSSIIGMGEPVIILHGLFGESKNWHSIATELASSFEVHLIDQRNHGNSFHHKEHNYIVLAEDLNHYIEEKSIANYSIIGHSMGGKVAMQFALLYPNKLKKLIIVDIAPKQYKDNHVKIFQGLNRVLSKSTSRKEAQEILMQYSDDIVTNNFLLKGLTFSKDNQPNFKFNITSIEENMPNMLDAVQTNTISNSMIYFLSGTKSDYIKRTDMQYIEQVFPNNQIINIENAGHWIHFDQKEIFLKTIKIILMNN